MRVGFISPHLDDAVWSCGGRIAALRQEGHEVVVHTVFTECGEETATRRSEDDEALVLLDASAEHWGFIDARWRRRPDGQPQRRRTIELFLPPRPADLELVEPITGILTGLAGYDLLYAPLAVGGHVDHRLVNLAMEQIRVCVPVRWYEEIPYHAEAEPVGMQRGYEPVDAEAWIRAASAYRSQIGAMFSGASELVDHIHGKQRSRRGLTEQSFWSGAG